MSSGIWHDYFTNRCVADYYYHPTSYHCLLMENELELEKLESIELGAPSPLYINVDVNDLLETRTEEQVFEFLGKLKDLFSG